MPAIMVQSITDNQKAILHQAIENGDPELIAKCIVTVEEIYQAIRVIFTREALGPYDETEKSADGSHQNVIAADHLVQVKIEPSTDQTSDHETGERYGTNKNEFDSKGTRATKARDAKTLADYKLRIAGTGQEESEHTDDVESSSDESSSLTASGKLKPTQFACHMCSYTAPSIVKLVQHKQLCHCDSDDESEEVSKAPILCSYCPYKALSRKDLNTHCRSHHPYTLKTYKCTATRCMFTAGSKQALSSHMAKSHPELCHVFRCEQCDFQTVKRANFRQHAKTHLRPEEKPYRCDHESCTYSSANKEGLKIHLNSAHKGIKPFLCDTCGQSFTGISMLSKHKLMKHKPKHLSCPHCDYKTSLQTWLKDHMKRHSNETPFVCQYCSYAAKKPGRLKVHLRIHTGERPYKCHLCEYGAMEGAPLKKHLKNQHNLQVHRIDVREGKLFLTNGEIVETGLGTTTAPLPPGSFQGSQSRNARYTDEEEDNSQMVISEPYQANNDELSTADNNMFMAGTTKLENILAHAATLSALPVQSMSPVQGGATDYTHQTTN